jgi:hypothetical protein
MFDLQTSAISQPSSTHSERHTAVSVSILEDDATEQVTELERHHIFGRVLKARLSLSLQLKLLVLHGLLLCLSVVEHHTTLLLDDFAEHVDSVREHWVVMKR